MRRVMKSQPDRTPGLIGLRGFDFPPTQGSSTKNAPSRSAVEPQRRAGLGVRGLVDPSIQVPSQRQQDSPKPPPTWPPFPNSPTHAAPYWKPGRPATRGRRSHTSALHAHPLLPAPRTTTTGPTRHPERMNYYRDAMQMSRESEPTSTHPTAIEVMNLSDIPELRKIALAPAS